MVRLVKEIELGFMLMLVSCQNTLDSISNEVLHV